MSDLRDLGSKVELAAVSTNKIVERIKRDFFIRTYKEIKKSDSPETVAHKQKINDIIERVYEEKTGTKFDYDVFKKAMPRPVWCMGPPGQGKTAAFLVAAEEFAKECGFHFIREVTDDYEPNPDGLDFPLVIQETAGENSAITFAGVPKAEEVPVLDPSGKPMVDGTGKAVTKTVLKRALNYRFTIFDRCAGGLVLFDDAANASPMIQNVLLPVAQTNTFQSMKLEAMVGFTGNLGSLDGTHTSELSSALITRVNAYFVQDNYEDYIKRGYERYNDDLGDLGLLTFIRRNPNEFAELPRTGAKSGFACPRSHSNMIEGSRAAVQYAGGRGKGENAAFEEIRALAYSCYGPKYAQKVVAFYQTYIQGADPLARKAVVEGNLQKDEIQKKYKGGSSSETMMFGYQFVTACSDYFVTEVGGLMKKLGIDRVKTISDKDLKKMLDTPEFKTLCEKYGNAILMLDTQEFSFGLEHLKGKMVSYAPALATVNGTTKDIAHDMGNQMAVTLYGLESCTQNYANLMVKIITGTNRVQSNFTASQMRGGRGRLVD